MFFHHSILSFALTYRKYFQVLPLVPNFGTVLFSYPPDSVLFFPSPLKQGFCYSFCRFYFPHVFSFLFRISEHNSQLSSPQKPSSCNNIALLLHLRLHHEPKTHSHNTLHNQSVSTNATPDVSARHTHASHQIALLLGA